MRFITLKSPVISCLVKCFKWLLKLNKGQRSGKGHVNFVFRLSPTIRSPKGPVPFSRGLLPLFMLCVKLPLYLYVSAIHILVLSVCTQALYLSILALNNDACEDCKELGLAAVWTTRTGSLLREVCVLTA